MSDYQPAGILNEIINIWLLVPSVTFLNEAVKTLGRIPVSM